MALIVSGGYLTDRLPTKRSLFAAGAIGCPSAIHSRIQEGPVQLHGRLGADSWKASGVLDPEMKVHEWP